jgi:hypothetical protein
VANYWDFNEIQWDLMGFSPQRKYGDLMGFSPRDDVHWIPTPFRNNQWNLTNRDGPPDLAQLRRHGSGVPKLSLSGLRIASLIMLELLFWTYFKLLLDVATIYNYIH